MQDIYNLAWKLAYVVNGKASHQLLDTYNTERKPIDEFIMYQAFSRFESRVYHRKPTVAEVEDICVEIGHRYQAGALIPDPNTGAQPWEDPYFPSATAGARIPHVQLVDGAGNTASTLDLVKKNFVLFAAEDSSPWVEAARNLQSLEVDAYVLNEGSAPYADKTGRVKLLYRIGDGEAVLIRPDGYIAWRTGKEECGHDKKLAEVLGKILE